VPLIRSDQLAPAALVEPDSGDCQSGESHDETTMVAIPPCSSYSWHVTDQSDPTRHHRPTGVHQAFEPWV
jgi:hypothetical protein